MLGFLRKKKEKEELRQELREELKEELREELLQELEAEARGETEAEAPEEEPPASDKAEEDPLAGLESGDLVEVLSVENHLFFVATVHILDRDHIELREETEAYVPQAEYNMRVKVRAFRSSERVIALYGQICGSSASFWRVDRLEAIKTPEKRDFFRQNIRLEAQIRGMQDSKSQPCRLLDISAGGALVRCQEDFRAGQLVRLIGVHLTPGEDAYNFTCRIQRVQPSEGSTDYGCRFVQMNSKDEDRLMRSILILQRKALQARRNGGEY